MYHHHVAASHPWFMGSFVFYASNKYAAREAYEMVYRSEALDPSGRIETSSGETVAWFSILSCLSHNSEIAHGYH